MPTDLQVVLGATGGVGQALVQALAAQGAQVRAVNRSGRALVPASVEVMGADLTSRESTRAACQGATVVYHCAGVPYDQWAMYLPVMLDNVIAAVSATEATLVYSDNTYMYAPTSQLLTEDSRQAPVTGKGKLRKHLAETILAAHAQGQIRATIGRAPDFYGPGVRTSAVGEQFFNAVVTGKRVPWLGKLDVPHALVFVEDFARGLTNGVLRESVEMLYEFNEPYLIDGSKYTRAFDGLPTSHQEAMRRTVPWYRESAAPKASQQASEETKA